MQRINQITSRIQAIQAKIENPPIDGGFRALLNAQISRSHDKHADRDHAADHTHDVTAPVAMMDARTFAARPSVTLGSMVGGGIAPIAPTYGINVGRIHHIPDGAIATRAELTEYMRVNRIEERNGKLEPYELTSISGSWYDNGRLLPPAAEAWELMRAAATEDGIDLKAIDTYRTWESQDRAHKEHLAGHKHANVLPPGTSRHGAGLAVDITNGSIIDRADPEWAWMDANARQFGWHPISNETWHWEFRGV